MFSAVIAILALFLSVLVCAMAFFDRRAFTHRINKLEEELQDSRNLLKRRGDLANEIAHEIKNPITAILCSAETLDLLIGNTLEEGHRTSLRYIKEYGDNLLKLVSDFLDVSMAEAGNFRTVPEPVEVLSEVQAIAGLLDSNAIKKEICIEVQGFDEDMQAYIDPKHFKQIMFNLLHNAIKFTPERGKIDVFCVRNQADSVLEISVSDNGVGIPQDVVSSVFDIYCQHDRNRHEGSGMGLGLALTKTLVDLAGGVINVESEEGRGSTFRFSIPLLQNAKPKVSISSSSISETESNKRPLLGQHFLVVDQDPGSRDSLASLIEAWGGIADKVDLATEAVKAISETEYDAVMIDSTRDGVSGYDLTRQIKDQKATDTRFILATKGQLDPARAKQSGASRYIEKPINGKALLSTLLPGKNVTR